MAGFIVAQFASPASSTGFYGFTSMSAFWISIALFIAYTFHIVERLYHFHWLLAEFAFSLIYSLFFFVASLLLLISGGVATVTSVCVLLMFFRISRILIPFFLHFQIFGFVSGAIYAYEAKSSYLKYSNGEIAQGERITPQTMA